MAKRYKEPEKKNKRKKTSPEKYKNKKEKNNKKTKDNNKKIKQKKNIEKETKSKNNKKTKENLHNKEIELELKSIKPKLNEKEKNRIKKEKEKAEKYKAKERKKRVKEKHKIKKENKKKDNEDEDIFDIDLAIKIAKKNNIRDAEIKKQKQKEKKTNRKKRIIKIVIVILILGLGITFLLTSPIFNIDEIQVLNNEQVSSDQIISLSGLKKGDNLFRFLKINVKNSIKQNAFIDSVEINRILPNKINITVKEREKKFSIQFLNSYVIINSQGYILEISEDPQNLIILKGMATDEENYVVGNRIENSDLEKLEDAIKIVNTCKDNNLDTKISYIDLTDKTNYIIYMEEEKKTIYIGDNSNMSNKIIYVQAIIDETKKKEGEIFVNGDLNNKFKPYFREKV